MRRLSCESGREEREDAVHAVVGQVKIDTSREEEAKKLLDEMVLPTSKAMAGFQGGYWSRALGSDSGTRCCCSIPRRTLEPPPRGWPRVRRRARRRPW